MARRHGLADLGQAQGHHPAVGDGSTTAAPTPRPAQTAPNRSAHSSAKSVGGVWPRAFVGPEVDQRALLPDPVNGLRPMTILAPNLDWPARSIHRLGQGCGHEGAERIPKAACAPGIGLQMARPGRDVREPQPTQQPAYGALGRATPNRALMTRAESMRGQRARPPSIGSGPSWTISACCPATGAAWVRFDPSCPKARQPLRRCGGAPSRAAPAGPCRRIAPPRSASAPA